MAKQRSILGQQTYKEDLGKAEELETLLAKADSQLTRTTRKPANRKLSVEMYGNQPPQIGGPGAGRLSTLDGGGLSSLDPGSRPYVDQVGAGLIPANSGPL